MSQSRRKIGSLTEQAYDLALAMLEAQGGKLLALPRPVATLLRVYAAQGVLDNGGYAYFFESDWPANPPYSDFVDSYAAIDCHEQARDLARVAASFDFCEPHLHEERRNRYIEERFDEETYEVLGWGDALCGDDEVWTKLEAYVARHSAAFRSS